jgi:hypothetical protein
MANTLRSSALLQPPASANPAGLRRRAGATTSSLMRIGEKWRRGPREWGALGCLLFILCGPAPAGHWVKPGVGPAETARVYRACRAQAAAALRGERHIDQDILATRGNDWRRAGTLSSERAQMGAEAAGRVASVIAGCMRAHGFARAG